MSVAFLAVSKVVSTSKDPQLELVATYKVHKAIRVEVIKIAIAIKMIEKINLVA